MVKDKRNQCSELYLLVTQHISDSACFSILYTQKHIWERNSAHGMQVMVVKIGLYCKNRNCQTLLDKWFSFIKATGYAGSKQL